MRVLKALASGLCFVIWGVGATILSWFALPISRLRMRGATDEDRMRRAQQITASGNSLLMHMMRWFSLVVFNPRKVKLDVPEGPFVLIANHPTLVDVCAITSVHPNICVIAKPKMTRSIFVGSALRSAGHIEAPGRGGSVFGGAAVITQALDRLERGFPVLVFPEGTRSPVGGVGKLSRGAFEIAKRANVPIVGVLITANPPTLHRGMRWYGLPKEGSNYSLECLPPMTIDELGGDSKAAAARYHEIFTAHVTRKSEAVIEPRVEATQEAGATP